MNADITSDEGKHQAQTGSSALSRYLKEMHDYQRDAMEKLYSNTIERPCSSVCEPDEIDFFLNCRQPLSFFHTKNNDKDDDDDLTNEDVCDMPPVLGPPGAYSVPTSCEYCGATHTSMCHDDCQRPTLFLRKMRPPFSPEPHRWDPVTGYELDEKEMEETQHEEPCDNVVDQGDENNTTTSEKDDSNKEEEKKEVDVESILQPSTPAEKNESSSWMNGFFLGLSPNSRTS